MFEYIYMYVESNFAMQKITITIITQNFILSFTTSLMNSIWNLNFNDFFLHCNSVNSDLQQTILINILNYTFVRNQNIDTENVDYLWNSKYTAWNPEIITFIDKMTNYLFFDINNLNFSISVLNNDDDHDFSYNDLIFIFFVIMFTFFSFIFIENDYLFIMCHKKSWYQTNLTTYHNIFMIFKCDLYNSIYHMIFFLLTVCKKLILMIWKISQTHQ